MYIDDSKVRISFKSLLSGDGRVVLLSGIIRVQRVS